MVYPINFRRFYRRRLREAKETWLSSRSVIATFILSSLSLVSLPIALVHYFCARGGQHKVRVELLQLAMLILNLIVLFYLLNWSQYWFLVSISRLFDLLYVLLFLVFVPRKFYTTGRALLLLLIEYMETVVIFAVSYLHIQFISPVPVFAVGGFPRSLHPSEAFLFSLGTFATFGSGDITLRSDVATALPILQNPLFYLAWQALCIVLVVIYVVLRISNDAGRRQNP